MKIRELLSDESKWTKGFYARNAHGAIRPSKSEEAVSWCILGAIEKCYGGKKADGVFLRIEAAYPSKLYSCVDDWNDSKKTKFEDVKRLVVELDI